MPKKHRLSSSEFRRLLKVKPQRTHGKFFSLTLYSLSPTLNTKVAFVVSKKTEPKAVGRNIIERRCRSIVWNNRHCLRSHHIYVFHAKKNVSDAPYSDIKNDITSLLSKVF